jgi:hypothetical protein
MINKEEALADLNGIRVCNHDPKHRVKREDV